MSTQNGYAPGLEGIIAAETHLSHVDGLKGELIIAGFPLAELAAKATFEETVYLLWNGRLPTQTELTILKEKLTALRPLPEATITLLRAAAAAKTSPMDALRMAAGTLDLGLPANDHLTVAQTVVARLPIIVATYHRLQQGKEPLPPNPELSHTANFLYLLNGTIPSQARVRGLETYLNTVVDHGLNASTFAARVIIATQSDLVSAVVGAIGALKGPLHGGAPGPALDTVFEIGTADRAEAVLQAKLDNGERLMGFGHRVYKVRDPRAEVLSVAAEKMFHTDGDMALYDLAKEVEETAVRLLAIHKPGRHLQTNVEFYTALLLHGLGLETDIFTPTFAIGRTAGWLAHCFEQIENGRLIRPKSRYIGQMNTAWTPLITR
ncbi:Citrate synthase (si) [hydrothermal vent metagenome]|uniref:Citrate synthase (Si) n=1 Tax=hydrothermal vent metagenome TaxID=652676 RepID=A0A3B0UZQ2_9ZZZZ